jgi:hypothetical protein
MANTIKIKRSAVAAKVPTTSDLDLGELALNTYDGKLYTKKDNGTASIVELSGGSGGGSVTIASSAADVLSASSGEISADDAGADKLVFWDDSAGKLTHLEVGSGLSISGTTITASGGGSVGVDPVISGMIF